MNRRDLHLMALIAFAVAFAFVRIVGAQVTGAAVQTSVPATVAPVAAESTRTAAAGDVANEDATVPR